jgi:tRNA (guanine37-N1)-methyltransferase
LISGDHAKINAWRREMAEKLTRDRRPDLWDAYQPPKGPKSRPKG